ncbi:barren [Sporormia fimetaria CBS 119925]|uniref:Condensin complex subunit 2 n=1 Tax=Sporormia fimetaria CBS 119925 TaxID=1340428 RepID=A0A6A6VGS7_9PLEO|nr:barren [Sporormia fimetaria CBS 119925]
MSLLKDGDGVNFQKASFTLDGCVKIYTNRVDSVADDTGKLLNGLAESKAKKGRGADADNEDDEEEDGEEGEEGQRKRKRRVRSAEATLAPSLEQLQNKKMDLELSVDPLFKKATADFDEGGAKGLLLNHLAIDPTGRIVFDSSDNAQDISAERGATPAPANEGAQQTGDDAPVEDGPSEDVEINIAGLAEKYFPDLARLDHLDVCPSLKTFDLGDPNGTLELPSLDIDIADDNDEGEGEGNRSGVFLDDDNPMGFDDDDDAYRLNMPETGFGEGGEAWAREAAIEPQARVHHMDALDGEEDMREGTEEAAAGAFNAESSFMMSGGPGSALEQREILSYFDDALNKNWAGPEHWRIRRIRDAAKVTAPTKRKEKEPFQIDFLSPMSQAVAEALYTPATSSSSITLPKAQQRSKTRNLLPDDKHFNSKELLRYFLKPQVQVGMRGRRYRSSARNTRGEPDEAFWAEQGNQEEAEEEPPVQAGYDADFFQDGALGGEVNLFDDDENYADARDHFSPQPDQPPGDIQPLGDAVIQTQEGGFGSQFVTQTRSTQPEYLKYARVAKKVDVRRLKEELWRGIGFEEDQVSESRDAMDTSPSKPVDATLKFTDVINSLQTVYPNQQLKDISTSYCFICTLHLANEKGLIIENTDNFEDLTIRKDVTADLSAGE